MGYASAQETFWAGEFGDDYVERCQGEALSASRTAVWAKILSSCGPVNSVTEFGANIGLNMEAFRRLLPRAALHAVEINARAVEKLRQRNDVDVHHGSLIDTAPNSVSDIAVSCGVLIHIAPELLDRAYDQLAAAARHAVVISEYYNPTPVDVDYRGHQQRLFKRDFAGEFLDRHPEFKLVDYGFQYHRDPNFPADDTTWFVLARR